MVDCETCVIQQLLARLVKEASVLFENAGQVRSGLQDWVSLVLKRRFPPSITLGTASGALTVLPRNVGPVSSLDTRGRNSEKETAL
jgi:hypothetical protein